jgi:hypothetical protein
VCVRHNYGVVGFHGSSESGGGGGPSVFDACQGLGYPHSVLHVTYGWRHLVFSHPLAVPSMFETSMALVISNEADAQLLPAASSRVARRHLMLLVEQQNVHSRLS